MKKLLHNTYQHRALLLMSLPAIIILMMFHYVPLFGITIAFKEFNFSDGIFGSQWVGLKNFGFLFANKEIMIRILRNTVGYYFLFTAVGTVCNIALAIALHECRKKTFAKITHTIMIFPTFVSYIAVTFIVYAFLADNNGMVNHILKAVGLEPLQWYAAPEKWPWILLFVTLWKNVGYNSILYLSALSGMDQQMFEAAKIDGATKWQEIYHITLPQLVPTVCILLLLGLGGIMTSDTGLFYQVTKNTGLIYETTQTIDSYVLSTIMTGSNDFGVSAAITLFQTTVGTIMVLVVNLLIRKWEPENALF